MDQCVSLSPLWTSKTTWFEFLSWLANSQMIYILIQICDTRSGEVLTSPQNYHWSGCPNLLIHSDVLLLLYMCESILKAFPCCVPTGPAWDVGAPGRQIIWCLFRQVFFKLFQQTFLRIHVLLADSFWRNNFACGNMALLAPCLRLFQWRPSATYRLAPRELPGCSALSALSGYGILNCVKGF